jgi:hypothetical protein
MVLVAQSSQTAWSLHLQGWTVKLRIKPLTLEDEATTLSGNVWQWKGRDGAQYPSRTELQSHFLRIYLYITDQSRSPWRCGLRIGLPSPSLMGLRVRIWPGAWTSVPCGCCVVPDCSLFRRSPATYGVSGFDCEASIMRTWLTRDCCTVGKNYHRWLRYTEIFRQITNDTEFRIFFCGLLVSLFITFRIPYSLSLSLFLSLFTHYNCILPSPSSYMCNKTTDCSAEF